MTTDHPWSDVENSDPLGDMLLWAGMDLCGQLIGRGPIGEGIYCRNDRPCPDHEVAE